MKHLVTQPEAEKILAPHLSTLKKVMNDSLAALNKSMLVCGEAINNRAKCALMHSIAIEKAQKAFESCPDIQVFPKYQSLQVVFNNKLVGRFKKITKDNQVTNAKTYRNNLILSQQMSLFEEAEPMTFVDITYKIDPTWADFETLTIFCRLNEQTIWHVNYKDAATVVGMQPDVDIITPKENIKQNNKKAQ